MKYEITFRTDDIEEFSRITQTLSEGGEVYRSALSAKDQEEIRKSMYANKYKANDGSLIGTMFATYATEDKPTKKRAPKAKKAVELVEEADQPMLFDNPPVESVVHVEEKANGEVLEIVVETPPEPATETASDDEVRMMLQEARRLVFDAGEKEREIIRDLLKPFGTKFTLVPKDKVGVVVDLIRKATENLNGGKS